MNSSYFTELFDYDSDANRRVLDLLRSLPPIDERTRNIFSHLLSAKNVWIRRLTQSDLSGIVIWPVLDWDECEALIEENRSNYRDYLTGKKEDDLSSVVHYQNSKGVPFETPVRDILMHVLIHGGYHRGQIAKAVRESGGEPISTDYITFVRTHSEN